MALKGKRIRIGWRESAGFTLVELLVALLLFSLLSLGLFASVRGGTALWTRVSSHADANDSSIHAHSLLRHLIEDAYPLFLSQDPTKRHVDFDGTKQSLTFLTSAPKALNSGGRSRVTLSVEQDQGHVALMLHADPELGIENDTTRKPLLTGASAVEFSYFGKARPTEPIAWHDDWTGESELPRLIRIRVQFPEKDGRDWPDLMVAPRIMVDVGCVFDQITMRCQGR